MLKEKVLETIKEYDLIKKGEKIVLCVSGGPDSMCMLHLFCDIKKILDINFVVAHVNHGLRENAKIDEEFVKDFCDKNNIDIFIKHANILEESKLLKLGIEETGRKIRYDFFDEVAEKVFAQKIATAHNYKDNAETIIMNVLRGSGMNGLKGIEIKKDNKYIRPLLKCDRKEIEQYCEDNNLNPRHDESNDENIYARNKIRNIVIPYIEKEFNPNIIKTINRLSEISKEESKYIENQTVEKYNEILIEENLSNDKKEAKVILNLKKFNEADLVIKRRLILYTINRVLGNTQNIEKINIDDVIKLCSNNIGNKYLLPNKNIKIFIKTQKIYFFDV